MNNIVDGVTQYEEPDQLVLIPVDIVFKKTDGETKQKKKGCLVIDDLVNSYVLPLITNDQEDVMKFIQEVIRKANPIVKGMMMRAYVEKKNILIMPGEEIAWHEYEALLKQFPFYKEPPTPAKIEEKWNAEHQNK